MTNIPPLEDPSKRKATNGVTCEPIPINKFGECYEGEESSNTLPIECSHVKSVTILDSGANVATATKKVWEAWGKLTLRKTRLKLQLVDGFI